MAHAMPVNVSGIADLIIWTNGPVTNGWFGASILVAFFIVLFMAVKQTDTKKAFATSGFITAMLAVFMRVLEFVDDSAVIVAIIVAAIGLIWLIWDRDS